MQGSEGAGMRIVLCSLNYFPEVIGVGKYNTEFLEYCISVGIEATAITTYPYYPDWNKSNRIWYSTETVKGVKIVRCPCYVPTKPNLIGRMIQYLSFCFSIFPVLLLQRFKKPDFIFVTEPALPTAIPVWVAFLWTGAKRHLHVQDNEIDAAISLGMIKGYLPKLFAKLFGKLCYRTFHSYSSISYQMAKNITDFNPGIAKVEILPNWSSFDSSLVDSENMPNKNRTARKKVLYSGNIAEKQGLEIVVDVACQMPEIDFVIVGGGSNKLSLNRYLSSKKLDNVSLLPLQSWENFFLLLIAADLHLVIQKKSVSQYVLPSKLTNILAVGGLAIVACGGGGAIRELEHKHNAVITVKPESAELLIEKIKSCFDGSVDAKSIKRNAAIYARENLDRTTLIDRFIKNHFESMKA